LRSLRVLLCELGGCHPEQCHTELVEALSKDYRKAIAEDAENTEAYQNLLINHPNPFIHDTQPQEECDKKSPMSFDNL
jgi:hypothetical protein